MVGLDNVLANTSFVNQLTYLKQYKSLGYFGTAQDLKDGKVAVAYMKGTADIPAKYADVDEYPFVLFHNGKCVFAHNKFMQNNSDPNKDVLTYAKTLSEKDANQNIVILFRKDYTHNGVRYDNLALLKSPVILDLN